MINLIGKRFHKMSVLKRAPNRGIRVFWLCRCDCGRQKEIWSASLKTGATQSCGCQRSEANKKRATHGMSRTRLFGVWTGMINRCHHPKTVGYKNYGARGIKVCKRWKKFINFHSDMSSTYKSGLQIERMDNNGNYCPKNCIWTTRDKQNRNKRNNRYLEFNGKKQTLSEWSRELGITLTGVINRITQGWSVERICTTPLTEMGRRNHVKPIPM